MYIENEIEHDVMFFVKIAKVPMWEEEFLELFCNKDLLPAYPIYKSHNRIGHWDAGHEQSMKINRSINDNRCLVS